MLPYGSVSMLEKKTVRCSLLLRWLRYFFILKAIFGVIFFLILKCHWQMNLSQRFNEWTMKETKFILFFLWKDSSVTHFNCIDEKVDMSLKSMNSRKCQILRAGKWIHKRNLWQCQSIFVWNEKVKKIENHWKLLNCHHILNSSRIHYYGDWFLFFFFK